MDTSLHQIFDRLGSLTAEVAALRRDIQDSDARAEQHVERADQHRAIVHRRVDEMVAEVGNLKTRVTSMETTVTDSKAVTDEVRLWKQRGIGALFVTGIASAAVSGVVVGFLTYWWESLMRLLRSA